MRRLVALRRTERQRLRRLRLRRDRRAILRVRVGIASLGLVWNTRVAERDKLDLTGGTEWNDQERMAISSHAKGQQHENSMERSRSDLYCCRSIRQDTP